MQAPHTAQGACPPAPGGPACGRKQGWVVQPMWLGAPGVGGQQARARSRCCQITNTHPIRALQAFVPALRWPQGDTGGAAVVRFRACGNCSTAGTAGNCLGEPNMQHVTRKDRYAPTNHCEALCTQMAWGTCRRTGRGWGALLGAAAGTCGCISTDVCGNIATDTCGHINTNIIHPPFASVHQRKAQRSLYVRNFNTNLIVVGLLA